VIAPGAHAELAGVQAGVAVQREDPPPPTPSRPPASTSSAPPPSSSAGWKTSLTRPGSWPAAACSARNRPAPSSTVVCTSWPARRGRRRARWSGRGRPCRPSSAARPCPRGAPPPAARYTALASEPMSTSMPVPLGRITGRSPAAASRKATRRVVRCSLKASSGALADRGGTRSARLRVPHRNTSRSASRSFTCSSPAMPTIPVHAESVFGKLGHEGVYHADHVPGSRVDGSLPFV